MERGDKMVEKERRGIEFILSFAWNYTSKMKRGGKKERSGKKERKEWKERRESMMQSSLW